ncbi:hypothetical protein IW262DRAFT_1302105 [Armillaria fumosa]|nr:hypothetical protein IW262DRAFT_1302105 [Armillaria fumosa]
MEALAQEETGYVPDLLDTDDTVFEDLYPKVNEVNLMGDNSMNDCYQDDNISSDDIILYLNGMVDANDLREHALSNEALPPIASDVSEERFHVKRGSSNPNHLLSAFPVLIPYGIGGFETPRKVEVPYEVHAQWAMLYGDQRFRKDLHFIFQVFGVMQKRNICRSAVLQMHSAVYRQHQPLITSVKPKNLLEAAVQETQTVPFSNPGIQALRSELIAV